MNLVARIINESLYPLAYAHEGMLSFGSYMKNLGKKPIVHFEQHYEGQNILLLALYKKGWMRPDIEKLLIIAKQLGMYVLVVNTLKIPKPEALKDNIDCYIERVNFGRDFGSYQTGFLHLYKNGWDKICDRLLMANDSIFFAQEHLQSFMQSMIDTNKDILGATGNYQYEHHLGSFFISFRNDILRAKKFRKYWIKYRKTNIRPKVIQRGELGLSRVLKKISADGKLHTLFDVVFYVKKLEEAEKFKAILNSLQSESKGMKMPRVSLAELLYEIIEKQSYSRSVRLKKSENDLFLIAEVQDIETALAKITKNKPTSGQVINVKKYIKARLAGLFDNGSHIHQNSLPLLICGCPIIKLDLLYRGVIGVKDSLVISEILFHEERICFLKNLTERPFGLPNYRTLDKVKFSRGLI